MSVIRLKPWISVDNEIHTGTSAQISSTPDFSNIVAEIVNSSTHLLVWNSEVVIPEGSIYYVRARRHFSTGNVSEWLPTVTMSNMKDNQGVLMTTEVVVAAPIVSVDKDELMGDSPTFNINTSNPIITGDDHKSTTYLISDDYNRVIWRSVNDTTNKTNITVPKSGLNILSHNNLKFTAIHTSHSGISSSAGVSIIAVNDTNFTFVSNMDRVTANVDYPLVFKKIDTNIPIGIYRVELVSLAGGVLWSYEVTGDITTVIIPGDLLLPTTKYVVKVHSNKNSPKLAVVSKVLTVNPATFSVSGDKNYMYDKQMDSIQITNSPVLTKNITTLESFATKAGSSLLYISEFTDSLSITDRSVMGLSLLGNNIDDILVSYTDDNLIIIDTYDDVGVPTFLVYKYNVYANSAVLLHRTTRSDESICLGKTGSLHIIDNEIILYTTPGSNLLREYNYRTGVVTTKHTVSESGPGLSCFLDSNGILGLIGPGMEKELSYNINTGVFAWGGDIPIDFRDRVLKVISLVNKDSLIVRTTVVPEDTDRDVLYNDISQSTQKLIRISTGDQPPEALTTSMLLKSGELLLGTVSDSNNKIFKFS